MPILNFKEIPQSNLADGNQDMFEQFARDFFLMLGFEIENGPDRGQDGGRDLIILEKRTGIAGVSTIKWLVSCKHKAHSGRSVTDDNEQDVIDRLTAHDCNGFIGFYSSVPSAPLASKLEAYKNRYEILIFDNERIEQSLLVGEDGRFLCRRYFPNSFYIWETTAFRPTVLLSQYEPLRCKKCGRDLLEEEIINNEQGIIVFVEKYNKDNYDTEEIVDIYWTCKGECDREIEKIYLSKGFNTKWEDISDIAIPVKYLQWNLAILNRLKEGMDNYSSQAYDNLKHFIIRVSQLVLKEQNDKQRERFKMLQEIPEYF